MTWLKEFASGWLGVPFGVAAITAIAYAVLVFFDPNSYRRLMKALVIAVIPGVTVGFIAGVEWWHYSAARQILWRAILTGAAGGLLLALALGFAGYFGGVYLAERRGVSEFMGGRTLFGLLYTGVPLGLLGGMAGYLVGRHLSAGSGT
jgi:hypothetical protein